MSRGAPKGYYCSEKFTWLSVDLEKRQSFSCCAAPPHQIDLKWLKNNPGQIFNTPQFQQERQEMLSDQPVASCETVCWRPERSGLVSRRMLVPTQEQRFEDATVDAVQELHIMLGSTCNMTCSYCCKQYSSAWLRDIVEHGAYLDSDRFNINPIDRFILRISQPEQQGSQGFNLLVQELQELKVTGKIFLTGGETFLYNMLPELVNRLTDNNPVMIYTGLGVDPTRFRAQIDKILRRDRVTLIISAENLEDLYEFNRYGNTWKNFVTNLEQIEQRGFDWYFSSTLTNLTLFGFLEFVSRYSQRQIKYEFCNDPSFLGVNVLDKESKKIIADRLAATEIKFRDIVIQALQAPVDDADRQNCSRYVLEFSRRRNLDLGIYPDSFLSWLRDA